MNKKEPLCVHCGRTKADHERRETDELDEARGDKSVTKGYLSSLEDCPGFEPEVPALEKSANR